MAKNFLASRNLHNTQIVEVDKYEKNNHIVFYYVNFAPSGFILINANNRLNPILAYSYDGSFVNDIPFNTQWIIDHYHKEQQIAIETLQDSTPEVLEKWNYYSQEYSYDSSREVSPLILAQWNQNSPWNNECPQDNNGPGNHALAGCVAVAVAQVIHYWKHPIQGNGYRGYTHPDYGDLFADFEHTSYNYQLMPNTYSNSEIELLLFHVGIAHQMDYGPDGSAAGYQPYVLNTYFSYDENMEIINRSNFDNQQDYENILISELDNNQPMLYRGNDDSEIAHAWVIDGYETDNFGDTFFHCNWGWGGSENGFYSLSSLDPYWYNFIDYQSAIIGIKPISGCMDIAAINYNDQAGLPCDNCCDYCEDGSIGELNIEFIPDFNWGPSSSIWGVYSVDNNWEIIKTGSWEWGNPEGGDFCFREEGNYFLSVGSDTNPEEDICETGITSFTLTIDGDIYVQGGAMLSDGCVENTYFDFPFDSDNDGIANNQDNCPDEPNPNQSNYDNDLQGDICDWDDDNDGVIDLYDPNDYNELICGDIDNDACDDCSLGTNDPLNDGYDLDADGLCDTGDIDDDNDGFIDIIDNCPYEYNISQSNYDQDEQGDTCDWDDDNDGVIDLYDPQDNNQFICGDTDEDDCDDCSSGNFDLENDCPMISGCTDSEACNYDEAANVNDGSCAYEYDCTGTCGGDLEFDCAGVCGGDNSTALSCCGLPFYDDCTTDCYEDSMGTCCVVDDVDECGLCFGNDTSCCDNGEINNDNPCNPWECWGDEWYEIIIDCPEEMGISCEGGIYIPPSEGECCSECVLSGDINMDSTITVHDIIIMVDFLMGTSEPDVDELNLSDINNDGVLTVHDIVMIVDMIMNGMR